MTNIIVFDAYGTLFDVNAAARNYAKSNDEENFLGIWEKLSLLWREKQISYTWYYTSMGHKTNFWKVTEDALDYALDYYQLSNSPNLRDNLLSLYKELNLFPEVLEVLKKLKMQGFLLAILSNGTTEMLNSAVQKANISEYLTAIISAEDLGFFKPHNEIYSKVLQQFSCKPTEVIFVSSNGWDAVGGSAFGFHSLWVNRNGLPEEKMFWSPTWLGTDLNSVLEVV